MDVDLVTRTRGSAGKCWIFILFSVGSLSPPTVRSRGLTSWWCLERAGFHLWLSCCLSYHEKIPWVASVHIQSQIWAGFKASRCTTAAPAIVCCNWWVCLSHQSSLRNDAVSSWHWWGSCFKSRPSLLFKKSPGSRPKHGSICLSASHDHNCTAVALSWSYPSITRSRQRPF